MDNLSARDILLLFEEITIDSSFSGETDVIFYINNKKFALICPLEEMPSSQVLIFALDDDTYDRPHIMLSEIDYEGSVNLPKGKYRNICLYEAGSVVFSLLSYEEKITDAIQRLLALMNLSPLEIEKEFQKEFLFYWDSMALHGNREIYIGNPNRFLICNYFQAGNTVRYTSPEVRLSDIDAIQNNQRKWIQHLEINSIYIPIVDPRHILPPTRDRHWTREVIQEIICGYQVDHIGNETFLELQNTKIRYDRLDIIFSMLVGSQEITFTVKLKFSNGKEKTIMEKIDEDIVSVEELQSKRMDFYSLNKVIGNPVANLGKKVLQIGCGSLGSYVASELVKNGFNKLTLYDGDVLSSENFMRWYYSGILNNCGKATILKCMLEMMHPEIHIDAKNENITTEQICSEMQDADYLVFTVGSSDSQILLNRALKQSNCAATVFYIWLEAGGKYSHILKINYAEQGCFECLFTDNSGQLINNKVNIMNDESHEFIIHNGCGGTRAAYGTSILLRTTAVFLNLLNDIQQGKANGNLLINISPESVTYLGNSFVERKCRCCGIQSE